MTRIPAKPTLYRGVAFRSRLEARWAVIFDELGIFWEYEPITFPVGGSGYTPDFRISYVHPWGDEPEGSPCLFDYVEVKPATHLVRPADVDRLVAFVRGCYQFHDNADDSGARRASLLLLGSLPRVGDPKGMRDPIWCSITGDPDARGEAVFAGACVPFQGYGAPPCFMTDVGRFPRASWEPVLDDVHAPPELVRALQVAQLGSFQDFHPSMRGA